jgi:hypothetical protein
MKRSALNNLENRIARLERHASPIDRLRKMKKIKPKPRDPLREKEAQEFASKYKMVIAFPDLLLETDIVEFFELEAFRSDVVPKDGYKTLSKAKDRIKTRLEGSLFATGKAIPQPNKFYALFAWKQTGFVRYGVFGYVPKSLKTDKFSLVMGSLVNPYFKSSELRDDLLKKIEGHSFFFL